MKEEYAALSPFGVAAVFCAGFVLSGAMYSATAGRDYFLPLILGVLLLILARTDAREMTRPGIYNRGFIFWSRKIEDLRDKEVEK